MTKFQFYSEMQPIDMGEYEDLAIYLMGTFEFGRNFFNYC